MKKTSFILAAIIFSALLLHPSGAMARYAKSKIAILEFQLQGDNHETSDMGKIVSEWLITALVKDGRFDVVERRLLEKILTEQKLALTGMIDATSAAKLGRVLGVKIIISGSVIKFQNIMEVNARIIDVESASIIAAESVKSSIASRLEDLVVQMADKIIRDFPLEGYIVKSKGDTVFIDLGRRAGVKQGMRFVVFKEGNVIKHPKTGEVLDVESIETGIIEITDIGKKITSARIVEEKSKGSIKYGQMIKSVIETDVPIGRYSRPVNYNNGRSLAITYKAPADMTEIDNLLETSQQLKAAGDRNWKVPFKRAATYVKTKYKANRKSPENNYYFAKLYLAEGKYGKAMKFLNLATRYDPKFLQAYLLKGDTCYEWGMKGRGARKIAKIGIKAYNSAVKVSEAKEEKALIYYKLGNIYNDISGDRKRAVKSWNDAVSAAPDSPAARLAKGKL